MNVRAQPKKKDNGFGRGAGVILAIIGLGFCYQVVTSTTPSLTTSALATPPQNGAGIGTQAPAAAAPAAIAPHIGSVVDLGNWRYSVRQVDTATSIDVSTSQYYKDVLKPKGLYVVVLLQLTNIGNRNFAINDFDFQLRDSKGIQYDPAAFDEYKLTSFRNQARLGEQMPPSVLVTTTLLFDVAPGTNGMYLYLRNGTPGTILLN